MFYAIELVESISLDELQRIEASFHSSTPEQKLQRQFDYGWALVRSPQQHHRLKGVRLLQDLLQRNEEPAMQRDLLWYIAVGAFRIDDWQAAKEYNQRLLQIEPANRQAISLKHAIEEKLKADGLLGLGIVGAAVGLAAIGLAAMFRKR